MDAKRLIPLCLAAGLLTACGPRDTQETDAEASGYSTGDSSSGATNDTAREAGATAGATTVPDTLPPSEEVNQPTAAPGND